MFRKLLPVLLVVLGLAAGVGAGLALKPASEAPAQDQDHKDMEHETDQSEHHDADEDIAEVSNEFVKLNNQFVVPVVKNDVVDALIVLSLSIEIAPGTSETVYSREPKLRDALLQVLFDYANMGGFGGTFTDSTNMNTLRMSLTEAARHILGKEMTGVLVTDIARQDI